MPLLFSICIQAALEEVAATMEPGEQFSVHFWTTCTLFASPAE